MAFVGSSVAAGALIGGGTLGAGLLGYFGAGQAADKQYQSQQQSLALQKQMFDRTQENYKPYLDVGKGATYTLGSLYGLPGENGQTHPADYSQFYNSPDYNFAQEQGDLGVTRGLNARGMNLSGAALKEISQFNQGLASQQFGNYYNRLLSLSQLGNNAASAAGGAGANFSGQMSNSITGAGQAQASGIVGGVNALSGGINSGISNTLLYNALNKSSYAPVTPAGASSYAPNYQGSGGIYGPGF